MKIQYNTCGHWIDCGDRSDYFADKAAKIAGISRADVYAALAAGEKLAYDRPYEHLRDLDAQQAPSSISTPRAVMLCKCCGQTGSPGAYPFSTAPGTGRCDDCV